MANRTIVGVGFGSPDGSVTRGRLHGAAALAFFGRRDELASIADRVDRYRIVTLVGVGGVGKTRLAIEVARAARPRFGDGVVFVDFAPVDSPDLVLATIAEAAGLFDSSSEARGGDAIQQWMLEKLADWEVLLVLDSCEHVSAEVGRVSARIVAECSDVRVLVTSRERLGVTVECQVVVGPLDETSAIELFLARAERAGMVISPHAHGATVASICRRLDCLPLAVELAAARVGMLSLTAIEERLDDVLPLLAVSALDVTRRQATMTAAIDWSHDLLDEDERRMFRWLGVFVGGWRLDAVEALCAGAVEDVVGVLGRLVDRSLVTFDADVDRYRLLEPVRQYSWRCLMESGDRSRVVDAHRRVYRGVAHGLNARILSSGLRRTDREELGNFRSAIDRALDRGDGRAALTLFVSLGWYWVTTGFWREGVDRGRRALHTAHDVEPSVELLGHSMVAGFLAYSGRPREAEPYVELANGLLDAAPGAYAARYLLSTAIECLGRSPATILDEAERSATAAADPFFAAYIASSRARYHVLRWELDEAGAPVRRAIGHLRDPGAAFAEDFAIQEVALETLRGRMPADSVLDRIENNPTRTEIPFYGDDRAMTLAIAGEPARSARAIGDECRKSARGGWMQRLVLQLHCAAVARARVGQNDHALALAAASDGLRQRLGYAPIPLLDHLGRDELAQASTALGPTATAKERQRGGRLGAQQAVELATIPVPALRAGPLSSREAELMSLVGAGLENREIADRLFISQRTVDAHLSHIRTKLEISARAALIRWAIDHGLAATTHAPPRSPR